MTIFFPRTGHNRLHHGPVQKAATPGENWAALIDRLALQFEPKIAAAFIAAAQQLADEVDIKVLAAAIAQGNQAAFEDAIGAAPAAFEPVYAPLRAAIIAGGVAATGHFADLVTAAQRGTATTGAKFTFGLLNPKTETFMQSYGMGLIKQISDETRVAIKQVVTHGTLNGINPIETARQVKKVVGFGLTAQQAQAVTNYRDELVNGDKNALARALRDARFDPTIKKVLDGKATLTPAQIDKMVDAYSRRMTAFRAETIARTESLRATNMGAHLAIGQAIDGGLLDGAAVVKNWIVAKDERVCPQCRPIPKMNPQGVKFGAGFATPLGPIVIPPAHPRCRCCCTYTTPSFLPKKGA